MEKLLFVVKVSVSGIIAWISGKLGILFPVLSVLCIMMVIDYISGMVAAKAEALRHPDDPSYGWSSKKGLQGILKKVGYLCVIAVTIVVDYIIMCTADKLGITPTEKAFFTLVIAIWYIFNEAISIIENAGRMGADVPRWLIKYIADLKGKIEK